MGHEKENKPRLYQEFNTTGKGADLEPWGDAELFEQCRRRSAVGNHPQLLLLGANVVAQIKVDVGLKFVHLVAERCQFFLQSNAGIARKLPIVLRPWRFDQITAMNAVGEVADREPVTIAVVLFLEYIEVFRDDETRAAGAAGKEEDALSGGGKRLAVGAAHAEFAPLSETCAATHVVEAVRYKNLEAPGKRRVPFPLAQVVGRRRKHIWHVGPYVRASVAGKIDRIVDEVGRHELGLAHGSSP